MIQAVSKNTDIIIFTAPEKLTHIAPDYFKNRVECIHAQDAESCLDLVLKVRPTVILMDLDLLEDECLRIADGLSKTVQGRNIPLILMAHAAELEGIGKPLLRSVCDIAFKPIRYETLLERIAFVVKKSRQRQSNQLDEAGRDMVRSARRACHELNQPLQYIMGSIQLALLDLSPEDPSYEMMSGFQQQSDRMAQITADLMQLIRSIG